MPEPRFVHLHLHSDYSMVDGLIKISQLLEKAVLLHMPALAITDFANLCGLVKFYDNAHMLGIKPIIGADFFVQNDVFHNEISELTILAANNVGYKHLTLLISDAYKRGYNSALGPVIDRNWLANYNEGLILLSGASKGDIGKFLIRNNVSQIENCLEFYGRFFPERYYLEVIRTGRSGEENYIRSAVALATRHGLPIVATNDVRFIDTKDFDAHEIRVAISNGYTLNDIKRPRSYSPQQYLRSEEEMCNLFADLPEALSNSVEIARRCNVIIRLNRYFLPQFPTGNLSTADYLIKCARQGLEERLEFLFPNINIRKKKRSIYNERLFSELKVINQMGFPGYFLIVMEFIQWSKKNNIPVGPGRGSGAGSLVAYALKITDLDPLSFGLLFERFLNPERISMPDIDVDFCMEKRDLVIDHVAKMYGRDAVSQIITFGTLAAKAAIRDVGRVLGYSYSFVNSISKLVPSDPGINLEKALITEPKLQTIYSNDEEVKTLIDMAKKLEGITRNAGKHAGGVVIAPTKITDFSPIYCDSEGSCQLTQFDKSDVEYVGLVKFDFLGLRTLTVINWTLEMINARRVHHNLKKPINVSSIPLDDEKSFNLLKSSETTAVFQLESRGMRDLIRRLQPDCFEDMIALVALFRPGPLQSGMVDNFINRKRGLEKISYPDIEWQHLSLKPVLESTYGIILYQEQVMQIAQVLAGYTLGKADILRRAMGKKKSEEMAKQRLVFKTGAERIGIKSELSMKIFDLVEKFAGYGFNKSHSAAYALVSYQTLWLKAHYPAEFMAAAMSADMDNTERIVELMEECLRMGLKVLPPNINNSQYRFFVNQNGEIVYGLGAIKGIGEGPIQAIIEARNRRGCFNGIFELCAHANVKKLSRRILEKLIMSGTFDCFGDHRAALIASINDALKFANQRARNEEIGQTDMFDIKSKREIIQSSYSVTPWTEKMILDNERETLGFYLSGHPITSYLHEIKFYTNGLRLRDVYLVERGKVITIVGLILSIRKTITKKGNKVSICTLDDQSSRLDIVLFANELERYYFLLKRDRVILVKGRVSYDSLNRSARLISSELMDISEARRKYVRKIVILLMEWQISNNHFLNRLLILLKKNQSGNTPVYLFHQKIDTHMRVRFGEKIWQVYLTDHLLNDLRTLVGSKQVKLEFN
ncbi:DNA polymerase III subunit alpha [Sodalis sp. CWE]|uniref:DNA polymerase III subunit alpha n=1 Tax=Sodalis sp. CWE TaxID=2803816 RepID=UPI001C7D1BCE|nr:DNA polymerase III subunit alpha [Sodalis sp. CWE]MBX4180867.1 DNA polymerase III subunit alpha [Sodalis sp. CWE]